MIANKKRICIAVVVFLVIFTTFISCNFNKDILRDDVLINKQLSYTVGNNNPDLLGFEYHKADGSFAIRDILLQNNYLYIVDEFHGNIKKIDINTGEIKCSNILGKGKQECIQRIAFLLNKFYVFSIHKTSYILDCNLSLIDSFEMVNGSKEIYRITDKHLLLETIDGLLTLDNKGEIINKSELINWSPYYKEKNGKGFEIQDVDSSYSIIRNQFKEIKLDTIFPYIDNYYEANNIDFDSTKLVFFEYVNNTYKFNIIYY